MMKKWPFWKRFLGIYSPSLVHYYGQNSMTKMDDRGENKKSILSFCHKSSKIEDLGVNVEGRTIK